MKPKTKEELFNLLHLSFWNAVERIESYETWIYNLIMNPEFTLQTTIHFVFIVAAFHNLITVNKIIINIYEKRQLFTESQMQANGFYGEEKETLSIIKIIKKKINAFRGKFAEEVWQTYCLYFPLSL